MHSDTMMTVFVRLTQSYLMLIIEDQIVTVICKPAMNSPFLYFDIPDVNNAPPCF